MAFFAVLFGVGRGGEGRGKEKEEKEKEKVDGGMYIGGWGEKRGRKIGGKRRGGNNRSTVAGIYTGQDRTGHTRT